MTGIKKAVEICGKQTLLAKACGASQQAVNKWVSGKNMMDVKYIPSIIKATEYEVNPIELRPDLNWSIIYESLKQVFGN